MQLQRWLKTSAGGATLNLSAGVFHCATSRRALKVTWREWEDNEGRGAEIVVEFLPQVFLLENQNREFIQTRPRREIEQGKNCELWRLPFLVETVLACAAPK